MTKERKAKALATVPEQPETVTPEQVVPEIVPKVKRAKVVDDHQTGGGSSSTLA